MIWAADVQASEVARWLETPADRAGRAMVEPDLTVPGLPNVFVSGDAAQVAVDGRPVPGVASVTRRARRGPYAHDAFERVVSPDLVQRQPGRA